MHKFCLRPCLSQSLFFPNSHPTRRPPSPNSSLSHTPTLDFVQSSPPLPVSHSHTLSVSLRTLPPFPFSLSPFPSKFINHFPPDPERYWREEGKNWFSIPSFVFFCLMVVIRDKNWAGYAVNSLFIFCETSHSHLCSVWSCLLRCWRVADSAKQGSNEAFQFPGFCIPISRYFINPKTAIDAPVWNAFCV
jgi:hypothetical protein